MPMAHRCVVATRAIAEGLAYCERCATLIAAAAERSQETALPPGFRLWVGDAPALSTVDYRRPAGGARRVALTRRSYWRFGLSALFLGVWGVLVSLVGTTAWFSLSSRSGGSAILVAMTVIIGALGPFVAATQLFNRTEVTFLDGEIVRVDGPLRWFAEPRWSRGPGDVVAVRAARTDEVRNVPKRLAWLVVLRSSPAQGRDFLLFDDLTRSHAEPVAVAVRALLERA